MRPVLPFQPHPVLLEAARQLGTLADFVVITANGPHMFQKELEESSGRRTLSMIDVTLNELESRGWNKVGLLGLGEPTVYMGPLEEKGLLYVTLTDETRERLDGAILLVMEGAKGAREESIAQEAIAELRAEGLDGIILGCTEISLLLVTQRREKT